MTLNKKACNFRFTLYGISEDESDKLIQLYDDNFCKLLMFTHELGANKDNPHIQGYISCVNMNRGMNVKNKINALFDKPPNPHIDIATKTSYENYTYITKELIDNPNAKHVVKGQLPLPPGRKRDDSKYQDYVKALEEGKKTLRDIEKEDLGHYVKHEAHYLNVRSKLMKRSERPPTFVAWFSGKTGLGKSYTARRMADELGFEMYEGSCENNFFNAYDGQECSVWDEYRSETMTFATLLRITDRYGTNVNIKGGKVFYCPKIQIFTSREGYRSAESSNGRLDNDISQLERRISYMVEFKSDCETCDKKVPILENVKKNSDVVVEEFKGVFKQFLIEEGYEKLVPLIKGLVDVRPLKTRKLVEKDPSINVTYKSNVETV